MKTFVTTALVAMTLFAGAASANDARANLIDLIQHSGDSEGEMRNAVKSLTKR